MKIKTGDPINHLFTYQRKKLGDGTWVVNEMCTCGALMTEHMPRYQPGHGPCEKTKCKQFTWAEFVTLGKAGKE